MTDGGMERTLGEQMLYYEARAGEYDEWWLRRGRYDHGAVDNEAWFSEQAEARAALISAIPEGGSVADLACGTGIWTVLLAAHANRVTAIDGSVAMLAKAEERLTQAGLVDRVEFLQADLFAWRPSARFDAIFLGFFLSHVPHDMIDGIFRSVHDALNPGGKVPTLVEDDFVLTESGAIVAYLADKRPDVGLMPAAGTPERAKCWQWMLFALTELEQPLWTISKHTFALPEKLRVPAIIPTAKKEFLRAAGVLATGLGDREWLGGDAFTGADLMVGHTLAWARAFSVPWEQPTIDAYAERVLSRPALARASAREQAA